MTGESVPVGKRVEPPAPVTALLSERPTAVLCGTTVTRGRARVLVTATGTDTELARIAAAARRRPPPTPLERRLDRLADQLLGAAIAICVALAALSWAHGDSLGASLEVGVALAVAAVPEGLVAVVTITLALGMRRLAERGAIVRRLRAVETLGSTTVICTDKTGTLTTNRMTVARLLSAGDASEGELLSGAVIASEDTHDPGEGAIAAAAGGRGLRRAELLRGQRVVGGEPFDSERKRMSVVVAGGDGGPDRLREGGAGGAPAATRRALGGGAAGAGVAALGERGDPGADGRPATRAAGGRGPRGGARAAWPDRSRRSRPRGRSGERRDGPPRRHSHDHDHRRPSPDRGRRRPGMRDRPRAPTRRRHRSGARPDRTTRSCASGSERSTFSPGSCRSTSRVSSRRFRRTGRWWR